MPHVMWMGTHAALVKKDFSWEPWTEIEGNRVRADAVLCYSASNVGVVQPGAPGRITRQVYLILPAGRILLESYSSDEFHRLAVVEISDDTADKIRDQAYLSRYCEDVLRQANEKVRAIRGATRRCMVTDEGKVVDI